MNDRLLRTFPGEPCPPVVLKGDGIELFLDDGKIYKDFTGGFTAHAILGWGNTSVNDAIHNQLSKIAHIDYKMFSDPNRFELAKLLTDDTNHGLDRVFLVGGAGAEACEFAMHMSYQIHHEAGETRDCFISRTQSYHGATTDTMSIGDRPNLDFYAPLFPPNRFKVTEHNKYRYMVEGETEESYAIRCAQELEDKILEVGPNRVCAFIAETMSGGLVGDVPPVPKYWKLVREVCDKYGVHLILDEVWCGTGTSGKFYCIDWDYISPDFIFLGKTLGGGYAPISAVVTSAAFESIIKNGTGRIENSTTFQGHSVGVAAALAVQKQIRAEGFLREVCRKGEEFRKFLSQKLEHVDEFYNVRGRGLRNSLEYRISDQHLFGMELSNRMKDRHNILISGKWHRLTFSPALNVKDSDLELLGETLVIEFKNLISEWASFDKTKVIARNIF